MPFTDVFRILIAAPLLAWLPGFLAERTFRKGESSSHDAVERTFLHIFISLLITAGLATFLAELGVFSLISVLVGLAIVCLALWRLSTRDQQLKKDRVDFNLRLLISNPRSLISPWSAGLLAILLLSAALFFRPAEAVLVMDDAGVYVIRGLALARTGQLDLYDPLLPTLSATEAEELLPFVRYESSYIRHQGAFYIWQWGRGLVRPAFFHLPSIWMAVLTLIIGPHAAVWATPLVGLVAVIGMALLGRRLFGQSIGLTAALLLTVSFPQIWFARYPTSEMFMQGWLLGSLFLLTVFLQDGDRFVGIAAGLAFGQLFLIRVDALVTILGIGLCFAMWTLRDRGDPHAMKVNDRCFLVPLGLSSAWASLHAAIFATPYILSLMRLYLTPLAGVVVTIGVAVVGGMFFIAWYRLSVSRIMRRKIGSLGRFKPGVGRANVRASMWVIGALILGGAVWAAGIRWVASLEAIQWLGWYLNPLGLAAASAGLILMVREETSRPAQAWLLTALLFALLYLPAPRVSPIQPWAVRRLVPAVLPALVLMMAYLVARFPVPRIAWLQRAVRFGVGLVLVFVLAQRAWPVVALDESAGAQNQIERLAQQFEPGAVVLFNESDVGSAIAPPLTYLYDRPAFTLQTETPNLQVIEQLLRRWINDGRSVYLVATGLAPWLADLDFGTDPTSSFTIQLPRLARSTDHLPSDIYTLRWPLDLYKIVDASGQPVVSQLDMGAGELLYLREGFHEREMTPDGITFRWTNGEAHLSLPVSPAVEWMSLRVSGRPVGVPQPMLKLSVDGHRVGAWKLSEQFITVASEVPAEAATDGHLDVVLHSDTWVPSQTGHASDDRSLGVAVDWIGIED